MPPLSGGGILGVGGRGGIDASAYMEMLPLSVKVVSNR